MAQKPIARAAGVRASQDLHVGKRCGLPHLHTMPDQKNNNRNGKRQALELAKLVSPYMTTEFLQVRSGDRTSAHKAY